MSEHCGPVEAIKGYIIYLASDLSCSKSTFILSHRGDWVVYACFQRIHDEALPLAYVGCSRSRAAPAMHTRESLAEQVIIF